MQERRTGQEVGESVRGSRATHEQNGRSPSLPITQVKKDLSHRHLVGDGISSIQLNSLHNESGLLFGEEIVFVGEVDDEEEAEDGEENGEDSKEHEDPLPSGESSLSVEQRHSV